MYHFSGLPFPMASDVSQANAHCDPVRAQLYDRVYVQNDTTAEKELDYWVYSVS